MALETHVNCFYFLLLRLTLKDFQFFLFIENLLKSKCYKEINHSPEWESNP